MPGPKPKDPSQRRRRNATPGFRQLPREGRAGAPPEWPLGDSSGHEQAKWTALWALPQAAEWERIGCADAVALYVRIWAQLQMDFDVKLVAELRQLDRKIGLSPQSMQDLRWEVADPAAQPEQPKALPAESVTSRTFVPPRPS